jgi:hypothetical protein
MIANRDGKRTAMTSIKNELVKAIDLALGDDWDAAHRVVQKHESDGMAAWIHAVLHKIEGDSSNSRYWYHRAGKLEHFNEEPKGELAAIKTQLTADART